MPNPFFYGGKVSPNLFVGRSQELRKIFSCLEVANTGQLQSVSIVGPHRMGRSSLLNYVTTKYDQHLQTPNSYRFVYISPHDANCHTAGEFLCKVLDSFGLPLHTHHNTTLQEFQEAILLLNQNGIHPIICLDEFEELLANKDFTENFFDVMRHLIGENVLAFVIASTKYLGDLVIPEKLTSPFPNIFAVIELGEFTKDHIRDESEFLIQRGINCDFPFNKDEANRMHKLGGLHPYKLQLAGSLIYQAKKQGTPNWKSIQHDFDAQIKQAGLVKNYSKKFQKSFVSFIESVGRALLEIRQSKDDISDSSALWWGVGIILFVLLIVLGIIPVGLFLKFGSHWLGK